MKEELLYYFLPNKKVEWNKKGQCFENTKKVSEFVKEENVGLISLKTENL